VSIQKLPEGKLNQLQRNILITLGLLALYRVGVHVPIPGVNTLSLGEFFRGQGANLFGMLNMFSGGALEQFSIFALGVGPYITASIAAQLLTFIVPALESLSKEGEAGRRKISQYTRYGAVVLAIFQGYLLATSLERNQYAGAPLVMEGGLGWRLMTVLSLAAGTAFVMWLGEQISEKGVGNGMSLIIFAGIVAGLPKVVANTYGQYSAQELDLFRVLLLCAICVAVVAGVVFLEQGARLIPIQYAKRQVGRRVYGGQNSHLPIRLNTSGVVPAIFASTLMQFPLTIGSLVSTSRFGEFVMAYFMAGGWLYNVIYVLLIIYFAFWYPTMTFRADDVAENLKKHGGFVPGVRPGARTAEYIDKILFRLNLVGGIYLASVCILPSLLASRFNVQFYFGGTSLLIVVGVALETFRQIEAQRQTLRYDAFIKAGTIRPRRSGL